MSSKQLYYVLLGIVGLTIVGLIGGAYGVDKLLAGASKQLVDNRKQVEVLDQDQAELTKAKADVQKYQSLGTIARSVVPQDKDQAQTIGQIVSIANANGIKLSSITFPASTLGTPGAKASTDLSQLQAVKGIAGVYNLQLTVQSDASSPVPYNQFISFLDALEHNRRTALVQSISIQPNATDRSKLAFNLVLDEYIKL